MRQEMIEVAHAHAAAEGNNDIEIDGQGYFLSGDGMLMPTKKGQSPPDLRYFKQGER